MKPNKSPLRSAILVSCGFAAFSCRAQNGAETMNVGNAPNSAPRSAMMNNIDSRTYGVTGEKLVPHGFDPGFTKKKVYIFGHSGDPTSPNAIRERWFCAAPPCPSQAPGTGYYNFTQDAGNADVASAGYTAVFNSGANAGKDAITSFNWTNLNGQIVSDLQMSNLHLDWRAERGPYAGIQMEYPTQAYPTGGVTNADIVPLTSLRYIHLKMRTTACKPPREVEPYSSGRIIYYMRSFNDNMERPNGNKGLEIALALQRFVSTPDRKWVDGGIAAPGRARWECSFMNMFAHPTCQTSAVDVDGPSWGVSKADDLNFWTSQSCNANFPPNQEFVDYVIDVPRLMVRLMDEGFMSLEFLKGAKYLGGILNGIEFFGPAMVRSQVAAHTIYKAESPIDYATVLGGMRAALDKHDPGFLSGTKDFVWRDTVSIKGACPTDAIEGQFCDSATQYGKACSTGAQLLICNNSGLRSGWMKLGSAEACRPEFSPGNKCSNVGNTCLNGEKIVACADRPYAGADWSPDTSKYASSAAPAAPIAAPAAPAGGKMKVPAGTLAEGFYKMNNSGAKFYYNGTNAFCWFLANESPNGKPINATNTTPQSMNARDDGRCTWDK